MAKRVSSKKALNAQNLAALGADRLADTLLELSDDSANWKRRLKLELAAAAGAADLALEIDKRLVTIAASRTRVSWRKRPELIADLRTHLRMIADRLAPLDPRLAFDRLVAWFDLQPGLSARVKDPKGELASFAFEAADDLAVVADRADPAHVVEVLFEALQTRSSHWAPWVGRAAPSLSRPVAQGLLDRLIRHRTPAPGKMSILVRKLADRTGDARAWIGSISETDRRTPETGAQIAERLAKAGLVAEARQALEVSRPNAATASRAGRAGRPLVAESCEAWQAAEIVVLDAEGRAEEAQVARWAAFERTLSDEHLQAFLAPLADFEDVEPLERAYRLAAEWPDAAKGLAFLMNRQALREAAEMAVARHEQLNGLAEAMPLWTSRLSARYPEGALALVRAEAKALARQGPAHAERVRELSAEAAVLAEAAGNRLAAHAAFIDELEAILRPARRRWG